MFGNTPNSIMPIEFQPSKTLELFREAQESFFKQVLEVTGIPVMGFSVEHNRSMTSLLEAGWLNIKKMLKENYVQ